MRLLQISSGRGPLECSRAVFGVFKEMVKEAKASGIDISLVSCEEDRSRDTYKSAVVSLRGESIDMFINGWIGSVQWIEQSPYRLSHKRKNWFVSISELPVVEESDLDMNNIRIDTMRSSGAGGQHVNKTESAVRVTHIPTGVMVAISAERSQHRNKAVAISLLMQKLTDENHRLAKVQERDNWQNHNELVRGNPVRVFRR